jgi:hypothetical protein
MDHSDYLYNFYISDYFWITQIISGLFILVLVTRPALSRITRINTGLLTLFQISHINFWIIIFGSFALLRHHYFWINYVTSDRSRRVCACHNSRHELFMTIDKTRQSVCPAGATCSR